MATEKFYSNYTGQDLEDAIAFFKTQVKYPYESASVKDINDIGNTYIPIVMLQMPNTLVGEEYRIDLSATYTFTQTNKSIYLQFSLDGGTTWEEFPRELKDSTDRYPLSYSFPLQIKVNGTLDIQIQARKETGAGTFNMNFANIMCERKK